MTSGELSYPDVQHFLGSWLTPQILSRPTTPSRPSTPSEETAKQAVKKISAGRFNMLEKFLERSSEKLQERDITHINHQECASLEQSDCFDGVEFNWCLSGEHPFEECCRTIREEECHILPPISDIACEAHHGSFLSEAEQNERLDPSYLAAVPETAIQNEIPDNYKTELCKNFLRMGWCRYDSKCQFAHGMHELRAKRIPNNYRTVLCKNFLRMGWCRYGSRCFFAHGLDKLRCPKAISIAIK